MSLKTFLNAKDPNLMVTILKPNKKTHKTVPIGVSPPSRPQGSAATAACTRPLPGLGRSLLHMERGLGVGRTGKAEGRETHGGHSTLGGGRPPSPQLWWPRALGDTVGLTGSGSGAACGLTGWEGQGLLRQSLWLQGQTCPQSHWRGKESSEKMHWPSLVHCLQKMT